MTSELSANATMKRNGDIHSRKPSKEIEATLSGFASCVLPRGLCCKIPVQQHRQRMMFQDRPRCTSCTRGTTIECITENDLVSTLTSAGTSVHKLLLAVSTTADGGNRVQFHQMGGVIVVSSSTKLTQRQDPNARDERCSYPHAVGETRRAEREVEHAFG